MLALFLNLNFDRWQAEASLSDAAPDPILMTPYWELPSKQQEVSAAKVEILNQRAEELFYGHPNYYTYMFSHEFRNQLFHQAFPETHLYVIWYDTGAVCPADPCPTTGNMMMASRQGVDYRMPEDFSQLLMDGNYQVTEENRDLLAHALILVTLPITQQSIYCGEGYEIDNDLIPILNENFKDKELSLIHGDFLKRDIDKDIKEIEGVFDKVIVVANLPYYITTPIIIPIKMNKKILPSVSALYIFLFSLSLRIFSSALRFSSSV